MRPRLHLAYAASVAALATAGCLLHPGKSIKQTLGHPPMVALQINVASNANDNSVVPFDAVVVRDKKLQKQISQMDAATWFGLKGRCTFRDGAKSKVEFHSWEFVPGQLIRIDVPATADTRAVIGFAGYETPGDHRVELKTSGSQIVDMDQNGIKALPAAGFANPNQPPAPEKQKVCPDD